jgi:hypothetical protein
LDFRAVDASALSMKQYDSSDEKNRGNQCGAKQ